MRQEGVTAVNNGSLPLDFLVLTKRRADENGPQRPPPHSHLTFLALLFILIYLFLIAWSDLSAYG